MSMFTPAEMMYIQKKKEHPLQWANDSLYEYIMSDFRKNKQHILEALRTSGTAVLFRFKDVDWKMTRNQEKDYLRNATDLERLLFRYRKEAKNEEIEDKCYKHYVQSGYGAKASIHAILRNTDFMSRMRAAFGNDFEVVETYQLASGSPRVSFENKKPEFMVLDATIQIEYTPKPKSAEQRATEFYKDYCLCTNGVMLVNKPVARHLTFEDDEH